MHSTGSVPGGHIECSPGSPNKHVGRPKEVFRLAGLLAACRRHGGRQQKNVRPMNGTGRGRAQKPLTGSQEGADRNKFKHSWKTRIGRRPGNSPATGTMVVQARRGGCAPQSQAIRPIYGALWLSPKRLTSFPLANEQGRLQLLALIRALHTVRIVRGREWGSRACRRTPTWYIYIAM